ncbi:hypothetical protein [Tenacibaculum sp. 190524A05c]|uniref:Uncharacterized protein n=1 Tax=Tenacibaculum platacis TaxID=3137852 RepID=A0ABM9NR65_9FLAO
MEKSIEKIWNEAFITEDSLIAPKINDLYNQKSKSIINRIKRTYEFDNKGLLPMAGIVTIGGILLSETIIGLYGTFLILALYVFNSRLLKRFNSLDIKSDNLNYLKSYRRIISSITRSTKKLFMFALPLAVLSIFVLAFFIKDESFLSKFITDDTTLLQTLGIGALIAVCISIICTIAYTISTRILYSTLFSKLDDIIIEMENLKE